MENNPNSNFVFVDSCIIEEIIFMQPLYEKCQDVLRSLNENEKKLCFSPVVIFEITEEINSKSLKENPDNSAVRIDRAKKNRREALNKFLISFKTLCSKYELLWPESSFSSIYEKCSSNSRIEPNDNLNLAIAISNGCASFLTKDQKIKDSEKGIKEISKNELKIIFIN